ncbi:hypothetical protein BRC92_03525 [Halobacteriales archaeon QS_4_69_31]|nr:MAG: hypothetical protein BRC92_03525 [Halobacteriales archaeon QS_4_69_31]
MTDDHTREARLAEELGAVAAQLREGEATLYGYRVEVDGDRTRERGGVADDGGRLAFELDDRDS